LTFHLFAALAEIRKAADQERTQAGLQAARARGRLVGARKRWRLASKKRAVELYEEKRLTVKEICEMMGFQADPLCLCPQAQSVS